MARVSRVGRNQLCPCGSGRKYKQCCERKAGRLSPVAWLAIAGVAAVVLAALVFGFSSANRVASGICPPGQVWSIDHGHCH